MNNPRLAGRYAKSLVDLALEKGMLETLYNDVEVLQAICKVSREFVGVLRSPVIKADKKHKIIEAVVQDKVSPMMRIFLRLIVSKSRESALPEILTATMATYDQIKGIHHVTLKTAVPVSEDLKNAVISKIKKDTQLQNINLHTVVVEDLVGGFVLEYNNTLFDSSIRKYLNDLKSQFSKNEYIFNLR